MDRKTIEHVAHLARLELSQQELDLFTQQISQILKYFDELSKLNTNNFEPMVTPSDIEHFAREDRVQAGLGSENTLLNAPDRAGSLFKVPPVV